MDVSVVYHSRYGNCEQVAHAILRGLEDGGVEPVIMEAGVAAGIGADSDLVIVGSPTRRGKASKPILEFIESLPEPTDSAMTFAAFGTAWGKDGPMSADDIQARLLSRGLKPFAEPLRCRVSKFRGPLVDGDADRAYEYGKQLASALSP